MDLARSYCHFAVILLIVVSSLAGCGGEESSDCQGAKPDAHDMTTVNTQFHDAWNSNNSIDLES